MSDKFRPLWYYMNERESIRLKKEAGAPWPWTKDPILQTYRFTNVKRLHDRTTQWVLRNWYHPMRERPLGEQLFNCGLFRWFGTIEFACQIGWVATDSWTGKKPLDWRRDVESTAASMLSRGDKVFTGAYIITSGGVSGPKYETVVRDYLSPFFAQRHALAALAQSSRSWQTVAEAMAKLPGFGGSGFMAKEVLQDALLTPVFAGVRDAGTWTPVGPGARRGLNRLYGRPLRQPIPKEQALDELRDLLRRAPQYVSEHVLRLDLSLHDIQFVLCETDKYLRVKLGEGRPRSRYEAPSGY
jgi:hypothetical protein